MRYCHIRVSLIYGFGYTGMCILGQSLQLRTYTSTQRLKLEMPSYDEKINKQIIEVHIIFKLPF